MTDYGDVPEFAGAGTGKDNQPPIVAGFKTQQPRPIRASRWDVPLPFAIAFATFAYPFVVAPLVTVVVFVMEGSLPGLVESLAGLLVAPFITAGLGCLLAAMTLPLSTMIWGVVWLVCRSFGPQFDKWRVGAHVGAWTSLGMFLLCLIQQPLFDGARLERWDLLPFFAFGPGVATPLAQYAGAWSQWSSEPDRARPRQLKFGVSQILVTTTWVAIALTLLKLLGWPSRWALVYLAGWLVYQFLTLHLVLWVCRWRHRRVPEGCQPGD